MSITYRNIKGSELEHDEVDENFRFLDENKADLVGGKVPTSQLPSYVDDVIEVASFSSLPTTGEAGKIYVALDTNKTYRWGGTAYILISSPISGTENKLPKFSSSGLTDSIILNIDKKIGINKEIPESIFDIELPPPVDIPLTGTFSLAAGLITGVNTLMLSELSNEATIKVVSTGNTYDLDMIMSDTLAYASSGGDLFTDEACVVVISETKYFDFMELLKSYVQFGNTTRENNEKVVYNKSERIYNESTGSIQQETNLTSGNSSSHSFRVNGTLAANIYILEEGGLLGITVRNAIGHGITYFSNNTIKITGLPTSVPQAGSNILYKDSNGFLKIA
jgi:hypothetical protein